MDWVLAVLSIIATVFVGWWFYRKTLRDPDCRFVTWNSLVFDTSPVFDGEVEIKVAGIAQHATRLSLSHLLIWNAGRGAMRKSDVVAGQEITIRPKGSERERENSRCQASRRGSRSERAHRAPFA